MSSSRSRAHRTLVSLGVVLLSVPLSACRGRSDGPNVLLVTIDTTRADHIGCYGYGPAHTPNIDGLAKTGIRFADASAVAPVTLPSHCSIMTGLYPPAHGVRDNGAYALGDRAVTLAERLKAAGYETQAFVSAIVLSRRYNLTQGFDGYDDDLWTEDTPPMFMIRSRRGSKTAERFAEWLGKRTARKDLRPFFSWVHFFDPHQPYHLTEEDRAASPTAYDAEIMAADRAVGALLDSLRKNGALANTIVVLTADHGESLGEHREKTHAIFIYDATIHVPLIVSFPRTLSGGTIYKGPVSSVDIAPTVLGMLGLAGAADTQGVDLAPVLLGRAPQPQKPQYIESLVSSVGFGMAPLQGIRSGGFKFIRAPRPELYDLGKDPHELGNLYSPGDPRAAALDRDLENILVQSRRFSVEAKESPMSRETTENLMSLGYLAPRTTRESMKGIDPKDGIALYEKLENARHLAQRRHWGRAAALLTELLKVTPGNVSARNILGLTLLRQGDMDAARAEYGRSLEQDPRQSRVYSMLGLIAIRQGKMDEAEKSFHRALEITPAFVEAMGNLGFLEALRGNEKGARAWYEKALAADPGFPRAYRLIADLYYERGDFAPALDYYKKALAIGRNDFQAQIQAGNCARRLGDPEGARRYFQAAAKLRSDSWIPSYNLACLDARAGRTASAMGSLAESARRGMRDADLLEHDTDLASVRQLPQFQMMLARLKRTPPEPEDGEE